VKVEEMSRAAAGTGRLAAAQDERCRALYLHSYQPMVRLAYVTTGSVPTAEDLTQDSFAELYRRFDRLADPPAYLRRIVVNRATAWVRHRVVERKHALSEPAPSAASHPPDAVGPDTVAVRAALAQLTPRHRAAIFLRFYLDLSESAIADCLGCRPGTVKSLLHRGLRTLREHFDER